MIDKRKDCFVLVVVLVFVFVLGTEDSELILNKYKLELKMYKC